MRLQHSLIALLFSALLTACGGDLEGASDSTSSTDSSSSTDSATVTISASLLTCSDDWNDNTDNCTEITEITSTQSGILAVTLKQDGVALSQEIVSAELTKGALAIDAVLTNDQGIAFFNITSNDDEGASKVTVTSEVEDESYSDSLNFSIGYSSISLAIENDTNGESIAQNSTTIITVTLTSDGDLYTTPVVVSFDSACATDETANLDATKTTSNGVAQVTYQAVGCVGEDTINATLPSGESVSTTINVASADADSIQFISATPTEIAVEGTGGLGRQETSNVLFKVVDENGNASSLQDVIFELERAPSGAYINPTTGTTNADGEVYTVVSAGAGSGTLKVKVKVADSDPIISSVSDNLSISTGLPDQDSFSISLENFSPEVLEYDGIKVGVSVQLADHHNNAVPDGTTVFFHTEAGAINDTETGTIGSCTTSGSSCSVNWVSGGDEPAGNKLNVQGITDNYDNCASSTIYSFAPCINSEGMGQPYGGRVTITAFAEGEETFTDNNSDGVFTHGETFTDDNCDGTYTYSESYVDSNNDGEYTYAETFTDTDGNGKYTIVEAFVDANGDGQYTYAETFTDTDGNGSYTIADTFIDANNDGEYTYAETFTDSDGNGLYTTVEAFDDTNNDGLYTYAEDYTDANNDGVYNDSESYNDVDANGQYTYAEAYIDSNGDGEYTYAEEFVDSDNNGVFNGIAEDYVDSDGNGEYTAQETFTDNDGDGKYTSPEAYNDDDGNGEYTPPEPFTDDNANGLYDTGERYTDTNNDNTYSSGDSFSDADGNGVYSPGDAYQDNNGDGHFTLAEEFTDSDGNGVYTYAETYSDANGNGYYDSAEAYTETNGDGIYTPSEPYTDSNNDGTYTATAESFNDANGNGIFDEESEPFTDSNNDGQYTATAESFNDANGDGIFNDVSETFTDNNGDGQYTAIAESFNDSNGDGIYNEVSESFTDSNGDGQYTATAEEFDDANGDGEYTYAERFTDLDGNGVYTVHDSFNDDNGDGKYTGDTFTDLPEVFYDFNEDGLFKANQFQFGDECNVYVDLQDDPSIVGAQNEDIQDRNSDGFSFGNGLFNGLTCSEDEENQGNCEREMVHVSDNITLIMASKNQFIRVMNGDDETNLVDLTTSTGQSVVSLNVYIADIYNNRPPAETVITVTTTNGVLSSSNSFTVPSSNAYGPYILPVILTRETSLNEVSVGILSIEIATPAGTSTTYTVSVSDDG